MELWTLGHLCELGHFVDEESEAPRGKKVPAPSYGALSLRARMELGSFTLPARNTEDSTFPNGDFVPLRLGQVQVHI